MTDGVIRVRGADVADLDQVVEFNRSLAQETEGVRLDLELLRAGVRRALEDPDRLNYLVAEGSDGELLGQLGFTREWSDWRNGEFLWLQSIYVIPSARRRGVFRTLFRSFMDEHASAAGICGVRLYMERDNRSARGTYASLGLVEADYVMMETDRVIDR